MVQGVMPTKSRKSGPSLQELRAGISKLNRAGLSNIKNPKSATRTKSNLTLFKKYRTVATGQSDTVKLSPKMAARYKAAKVPGITIIPAPPGSKKRPTAIVSKRTHYTRTQISKGEPIFEGMVARVRPLKGGEIETIALPISTNSIPKFIAELENHPDWNNLKMKGDRFTLRFNVEGNFYGLNDPRQFGTMQQLATFLRAYNSARSAAESSAKSQRDYLEMLEVVRIKKDHADLRNQEQKDRDQLKKKVRRYARLRKQRGR